MEEFTRCEVKLTLKHMAPLKSLGPNRMPPIFYQYYWDNIREEVTEAVLSFFNSEKFPSGLNHTYLTLIPKVKSPEKVLDFRLIALCNILYKLIAKVLANRLKTILPLVISKCQNAF